MIRSTSTFDLSIKILNHHTERFSSSLRKSKMTRKPDSIPQHLHTTSHSSNNAMIAQTFCCQPEANTTQPLHTSFNKYVELSSSSLTSSSSNSCHELVSTPFPMSSLLEGPATQALRHSLQQQISFKRCSSRHCDSDTFNGTSQTTTKRRRPNTPSTSSVRVQDEQQTQVMATRATTMKSPPILNDWNNVYESLVSTTANNKNIRCNEPFPKIDYSIFDES